MPKFSSNQTYTLAHSAQCKLNMSASSPDRNLRFILGHAFTLDKALLRVAEIEDLGQQSPAIEKEVLGSAGPGEEEMALTNDEDPQEGVTGSLAGGTVSFDEDKAGERERRRSTAEKGRQMPLPSTVPVPVRSESAIEDEDEDDDEERTPPPDTLDDESDSLGLTRFASASLEPPRMIPDSADTEVEEDEPVSPPSLPSDFDYATLIHGAPDEELRQLYDDIGQCPCHGKECDEVKNVWEVKDDRARREGRRTVVVQVGA